jgi:hypothetical protein
MNYDFNWHRWFLFQCPGSGFQYLVTKVPGIMLGSSTAVPSYTPYSLHEPKEVGMRLTQVIRPQPGMLSTQIILRLRWIFVIAAWPTWGFKHDSGISIADWVILHIPVLICLCRAPVLCQAAFPEPVSPPGQQPVRSVYYRCIARGLCLPSHGIGGCTNRVCWGVIRVRCFL